MKCSKIQVALVVLMLAAVLALPAAVRASSGKTNPKDGLAGMSDFILPRSDTEYMSEDILETLDLSELRLARNEIYARRGYRFTDKGLLKYFSGKSWYRGTIDADDFDDAELLNKYEKANIALIKQCEKAREQKEIEISEYVIPDSDSRYVKESDLEGLSARSLRIARNEIYARRGRKFKDKDLQAYFDSCSWYRGRIAPSDFDSSVFNKYEKANVSFIKKYETESEKEKKSKDYIIPDSDKKYLTYEDISHLSRQQLRLGRNEIYARHGRKFSDSELQDYFNSCSWYKGTISPRKFDAKKILNKYEKANIAFIKQYEGEDDEESATSYYDPDEIQDMAWGYFSELFMEEDSDTDFLSVEVTDCDDDTVTIEVGYGSDEEDDWMEFGTYVVNRYTGVGEGEWGDIIDFTPWE